MIDTTSHIRRAADARVPDAFAVKKLGQLVGVIVFGGAGALAFGLPVERAVPGWGAPAGLVGFVLALALHGLVMSRWSARRPRRAVSLQEKLHDLKQQEFALRYAEAKARGDVE
ncbi:MAG: hypothetical protein AAGM84_14350 [Pseudomonadota bacterium]